MMSILPEKILLATDGSEDAATAAWAAADLSNKVGAELYVVYAWQSPREYAYPGVSHQSLEATYRHQAERALNKDLERIQNLGGTVAEAYLEEGRPADAIFDVAGRVGADFLILGSRGLGTFRRIALGSVSEEVVHHARVPVLVVRGGGHTWPPERVVIGDDGSEDARRAEGLGISLARLFEAPTLLVRAHPTPPTPLDLPSDQLDLYERMAERTIEEDRQALEERAQKIEDELDVRPQTRVLPGNAAVILDMIAGNDESALIAVGSRGFGAVKRMALGSTSTKILRGSRGPVLVCPHPVEAPEG